MSFETWLPTIVAGGALGLVWFGFRTQKKELKDDVKMVKETYLKEETHGLLCENTSLKINEHLTKEMTKLKDEVFGKFRDLEKAIKDNGK